MAGATAKDLEIHHLIISGDDLAFARFCDAYYEPIYKKVSGYNKGIHAQDETLVADVVTDVFLKYFREPGRYDPAKLGLERFLIMDAEGDLKNEWEKRKRINKNLLRSVELQITNGNSTLAENKLLSPFQVLVDKEAAEYLEKKLYEVFQAETDIEMAHLMLSGERKSEEYARILRIDGLPVEEQRREVKKHKDRIEKVMQRKLKERP
jgi:RNA polymerase sigma-70 factor (ECF subfamily)